MVKHCCERMTHEIEKKCEHHPDPFDCSDALIYYDPKFDEYGLILHDGGPVLHYD